MSIFLRKHRNCVIVWTMQKNRKLRREATSEHQRVHRAEFTPAILALGALLAVIAICSISITTNVISSGSARHVASVVLLCATLALLSGTVLVAIVFDGRAAARREAVDQQIFAEVAAAHRAHKQAKTNQTECAAQAERMLAAFARQLSPNVASRTIEMTNGLVHAGLTPRILSQRPISARVFCAGTLTTT